VFIYVNHRGSLLEQLADDSVLVIGGRLQLGEAVDCARAELPLASALLAYHLLHVQVAEAADTLSTAIRLAFKDQTIHYG
jgi:hypothetical protein